MTATPAKPGPPDFASASVARHLARGAVGFGALVGTIVLLPRMWPVAVLLVPVALVALRGCPMCWAIGLAQTITRGRLRRSCEDGMCTIRPRSAEDMSVKTGSVKAGSVKAGSIGRGPVG